MTLFSRPVAGRLLPQESAPQAGRLNHSSPRQDLTDGSTMPMTEQSPQAQTLPPPLPVGTATPPPAPISYAGPGAGPPGVLGPPPGPAQKLFDTVGGPNTRLFDNLIQLACVVVGVGVG